VTIRDIAAKTGLSVYTVPLALRGETGVSLEARRQVVEAARAVGYDAHKLRRKPGARSRGGSASASGAEVSGQRGVITIAYHAGASLERLTGEANYGRYLRGMRAAAKQAGVALVTVPIGSDATDPLQEAMLTRAASGQDSGQSDGAPAGVILLGIGEENEAARRLLERGTPTVLLSRYSDSVRCSWVSVDHTEAGELLTDHLLARGYRDIFFAANALDVFSFQQQRHEGYVRAMARHGLAPRLEAVSEHPKPAELDRLASLIRRADRPAVFCVQDRMALGVREGLAQRGLSAPGDVGVAGYDNLADALAGAPADLTSIGFPRERMGAMAVRLLLALRDEPSLARQQLFVKPELHARGSTARPSVHPTAL
jgi:LacI family transcriptional regulator